MSKQPLSIDQTWLECITCGHKADLLEEEKFRCPHCGDLYEVRHNFTGADWEKLRKKFDGRAQGHLYGEPDALSESGVWRYKELINPFLPHEFIRSLPEGNMPITQCLGHLCTFTRSSNLWMIQEEFIDWHEVLLDDPQLFNPKLMDYLLWYNTERPHWSLRLQSPVNAMLTTNSLSRMRWTDTQTCKAYHMVYYKSQEYYNAPTPKPS